jgi:hypothetical protein
MTGNLALDRLIDTTMVPLTGMSKESYRRRHVSAHYADVGNVARVFSDVWLPFISFPALYYARPWRMLTTVLDKEFCVKQKLNRYQLVIETIGLYTYLIATVVELFYYKSFYLFGFHMLPLMLYQGAVLGSAAFAHSGIDKRNSFDSNGLFDPDTLPAKQGLLAFSMRFIGVVGNWAVLNHGIHHAFTQLPLEIINQEYKFINQHCLETKYKHIRYNQLLTMKVMPHLFARIPAPKWYDYILQFIICCISLVGMACSVIGLHIMPMQFEVVLIDYRILFYSTRAERAMAITSMWNVINLKEFAKTLATPNDYVPWVLSNYDNYMKDIDAAKRAGQQIEQPPAYYVDNEVLSILKRSNQKKAD